MSFVTDIALLRGNIALLDTFLHGGAGETVTLGGVARPTLAGLMSDIADFLGGFARGRTVVTASTAGNATISHGLASVPTTVLAGILGDTPPVTVEVQTIGPTGFIVRFVAEADGGDITSGTFTVVWAAWE